MKAVLWLGVLGALVITAPAQAWDTLPLPGEPADASCPGGVARSLSAGVAGIVTARSTGGAGDWDLALVDTRTGVERDASRAFGAAEVAATPVRPGDRLRAELCPI
jgi:hypothetical protein